MRRLLVGILTLIATESAWAQQDPQFSQYMFNKSYWGVALTGLDGNTSLSAFSRSQWLGYEASFDQKGGAPSTQFLNFTIPLTLFKIPVSLGANLIYDKIGPISSTQIQVPIAYHHEFPRGTLSVGFRPGIYNQVLNSSILRPNEQNDPKITNQRESQITADLDAGLAYSTESYIISLGVNHLLRPTYNYDLPGGNESNEPLDFLYNLYGEYNYDLTSKLTISPSALIQTDINAYSFNLGIVATYYDKMWGGVSYRNSESVVILLGYSFLDKNVLSVGYSFDYIINDRAAKAQTSHELYLRYNLPSLAKGMKKVIKTPRFSF